MLFFVFLCYNLDIIEIGEMCVKRFISLLLVAVVLLLPFSAKALGLQSEAEKSCRNEETGKCEQAIKIYLTDIPSGADLTNVEPTLTLTGDADKITVKSITGANDNIVATQSRSGNVITMKFNFLTSVTGTKIELGTIVLELEDSATNCSGKLGLNGIDYEIEVDVEEEVSTGATLPLAILACGVGAVAVIYIVSKKNKKLYKI